MGNASEIDETTLLNIAGRWLHALTEGSGDVVTLVDAHGRVQYSSSGASAQELTGLDGAEATRVRPADLVHPEDRDRAVAAFRQLVLRPGARATVEVRLRHKDRGWIAARAHGYNRLEDPVVRAIVVHTRAVARAEGPVAAAEETASQRPLPSEAPLAQRANSAFIEVLSRACERARVDPNSGFSVLLVELENFKMLLGTYGDVVAGEVQNEASRRLAELLGEGDVLADLGAGEFGVLLSGSRDQVVASKLADRIQQALAARYRVRDVVIASSAVVGIATSERTYARGELALQDASLALNRARVTTKRRRAVFQTSMRVEDTRRMAMLGGLHGALQGNQLRLHYQPIVTLASRQLVGFEALLRWEHPNQGFIMPGDFIPAAEESGLIVPIGAWVLKEATRQMAEWNARFRPNDPLYVSVNVSGKQFVEDDLAAQIESAVSTSQLAPDRLKLEITETSIIDQQASAVLVLHAVKALGVKISLDDFGTGYSSFNYLHQLPYDTLKIDRSFVSRLGEAEGNAEIVHAIIVLAHNLRMEVVAEGVETERQADELRNMWCDSAQGYFFGRPLDPLRAAEVIAAGQPL
ncbi:MAG: EAL domain-containing protein [Myxococcales bacterium]|nr:EAL domain-containing protein [Myxococcales bacterium]